jgi:hypothetical protein
MSFLQGFGSLSVDPHDRISLINSSSSKNFSLLSDKSISSVINQVLKKNSSAVDLVLDCLATVYSVFEKNYPLVA